MLIPNSTLDAVSKMSGKKTDQLLFEGPKRCVLSLDCAMQRSYSDLINIHCNILEKYIKNGRSHDYSETSYYKKFSGRTNNHYAWNGPWSHGAIIDRMNKFFDLFDKIKTDGFSDKFPISVLDMSGNNFKPIKESFMLYNDAERCINYLRWDGSHRCSVAYVLGIDVVPVSLTKLILN